jgi:hypothetical protein
MWHHDMARRVVEKYVDVVTEGTGVILDDATLDKPYGWVFFYQSRAYIETGDESQVLLGNAPVIFNRIRGEYSVTGTAHPIEHYLSDYEAGLPPGELALPLQMRDQSRTRA